MHQSYYHQQACRLPSYKQKFYQHIGDILKADDFRDTTVKIFKDVEKYTARLEQMKELSAEEHNTAGIINTLNSVAL